MKIMQRDLLSFIGEADCICVTTNKVVKSNDELVMGAGIAKVISDKYPTIAKTLGGKVKATGKNIVFKGIEAKDNQGTYILSFPTKEDYRDKSSLELIRRSAIRLKYLADVHGLKDIVIPCPGIGCGGLDMEEVVELLGTIFDERFTIVYK